MILSNEFLFLSAEKNALDQPEGSFARQILILALQEADVQAGRDFISKVLAAVQLDKSRDTLFAEIPPDEPRNLAADLNEWKPAYVIVFGVPAAQLGLNLELKMYQPLHFYGCTWLFADKCSSLEPDKAKKAQLWTALKQLFH